MSIRSSEKSVCSHNQLLRDTSNGQQPLERSQVPQGVSRRIFGPGSRRRVLRVAGVSYQSALPELVARADSGSRSLPVKWHANASTWRAVIEEPVCIAALFDWARGCRAIQCFRIENTESVLVPHSFFPSPSVGHLIGFASPDIHFSF